MNNLTFLYIFLNQGKKLLTDDDDMEQHSNIYFVLRSSKIFKALMRMMPTPDVASKGITQVFIKWSRKVPVWQCELLVKHLSLEPDWLVGFVPRWGVDILPYR